MSLVNTEGQYKGRRKPQWRKRRGNTRSDMAEINHEESRRESGKQGFIGRAEPTAALGD